jgi:peroxiredoxin
VRSPRPVAFALAFGLALACDGGGAAPSAPGQTSAREPAPARTSAPAANEIRPVASRGRAERPLPAFSGTTFDGQRLSASSLIGKRLVVFFFDARESASTGAARAMAVVAKLAARNNFQVLGVATGAPTPEARAFMERHGLAFTTLNDASGAIARRLQLPSLPAAFLVVDAEGYVVGAMSTPTEDGEDVAGLLEGQLRQQLRLPVVAPALLEPGLGEYPRAPEFTAGRLEGGEPFRLAELHGRPVVLMFFLPSCPHCHHALEFFREELAKIPEARRPVLVGISIVRNSTAAAVRRQIRAKGLDFFPVLLDPDGAVSDRYAVAGYVPDILLINAEGSIRARTSGWRENRDPALMRMRLAQLAGEPVPMLLHKTGYSGNEFCGVCHEKEFETWRFTKHSQAFDTLVRHAAERDAECVSCHVVGFGGQGGYSLDAPALHLEDVGCETCHDRGGSHLTPQFVSVRDYTSACIKCHDAKHSLGFDYESFLSRVSHAANARLLELPPAEKRKRLAALPKTRKALFPDAAYVGSAACRSCHEAEYATWAGSGHGHAVASLETKGKAGEGDCQRCHTTGYDRPGGFPVGASPAAHEDLARVGCESCHGPGGEHVAEGARRTGDIVSLADKCDSCVILQICGECHDDANDPGFEFRVQEKIEAQRHGTIQPSVERPSGDVQARLEGSLAKAAMPERTFTAAGER